MIGAEIERLARVTHDGSTGACEGVLCLLKVAASAGNCEAAAEGGEVGLRLAKTAVVGCTTAAEVRGSDAGLSTVCAIGVVDQVD